MNQRVFYIALWGCAFFSLCSWKKEKLTGDAFWNQVPEFPIQKIEGFLVRGKKEGRYELKNIFWKKEDSRIALPAVIHLSEKASRSDWLEPLLGSVIEAKAFFKRIASPRNPAVQQDSLFVYAEPRFQLVYFEEIQKQNFSISFSHFLFSFSFHFESWLTKKFDPFKVLLGFLRAVWQGNSEGLPVNLKKNYEAGGLLQILALSGQHVLSFFLVVQSVIWFWNRIYFFITESTRLWVPVRSLSISCFCALMLYLTSAGVGSMLRSVTYALAVLVLQKRNLFSYRLQIVGTVLAILLVISPGLVTNVSFILSAGASTVQLLVFQRRNLRSQWRAYLFLSLILPILLFPMQCFYFASVPLFSPFYTLIVSWGWEFILLPLAFFITFVGAILPEATFFPLASLFEKGLISFYQIQEIFFQKMPPKMITMLVPTLWECLLWQLVLVFLLVPRKVMIEE